MTSLGALLPRCCISNIVRCATQRNFSQSLLTTRLMSIFVVNLYVNSTWSVHTHHAQSKLHATSSIPSFDIMGNKFVSKIYYSWISESGECSIWPRSSSQSPQKSLHDYFIMMAAIDLHSKYRQDGSISMMGRGSKFRFVFHCQGEMMRKIFAGFSARKSR